MSRVERMAVFLLALSAVLPAARAQDSGSTAASLRPTGPVTINADRAEWEKGGAMVYTGNVRLESADLKLTGAKLMLKQFESGEFEARVDGSPATLDHAGIATGGNGGARPPVSAKAKQLTYDSRSEIVEIAGEAVLTRGTDEVKGDKVRYDVAHRRIEAAGGVQIVIQPPAKKDAGGQAPSPKTPAVPAPATAP